MGDDLNIAKHLAEHAILNIDKKYVNADGDTMTGPLTFNDNVKLFFGTEDDASIVFNGSFLEIVAGVLALKATPINLGDSTGDVTLNFLGSPLDGVIKWKDDEDQFQVGDDWVPAIDRRYNRS